MSVTIQEIPQPLFQTTPPRKEISEIAKITRQIPCADWKAWENLIGRGDDDTAEKEMAALVQKQIESSGLNLSSC